jgi:O-antigen ligase
LEQSATPSSAEARGDLTARFKRSKASRFSISFDRESIDTFCERGVLGTVLAMLVFGPIATGATKTSQFLVLLGLGILLMAFWVVRIWVRDQYRFLFPPFGWAVVAFTGYAIWRYTWVDIEYAARLELLQVILYAVVFFAVLDNLTRAENIQFLLFAMIGLATLNAGYAVFQYFTDSQHVLWYDKPKLYRGRGSGTYICPNHLVGFLEMMLPVALAYTITGRYKPITKVFLGYAAVAMLAGIGVSISRGGYIAVGASLVLFFVIMLWNRSYRIPALAILVLLLAGGSLFGFRSWQTKKRFENMAHANIRLQYWKPAVEIWKRDFWFGAGAQHFDWRYRPWRYWQLQGRPMYVHNDYLNTVTEYGTAGGAIVGAGLLLLGWTVVRSWKYVRRTNDIGSKPSNRASVVFGCSVGLVALAVHSVTDFNMHIPANALIAVTLMAILSSHIRFATERFWVNPRVIGRLFGTVILLGAAAYLGFQLWQVGRQSYVLSKYVDPIEFEDRIKLLTRAYEIDPKNSAVVLELGEQLRKYGWKVDEDAEKYIRESIPWFEKVVQLNRWNPYGYMNLGMCYHWLKEHEKATDYFEKAHTLDPRGYYMLTMYGWHKLQLGDLEAAQKHLKDSVVFAWNFENTDGKRLLEIVERRLAEKAAGR